MQHDRILILDYGSQFTQLIARRVREAHVYSEIHRPDRDADWVKAWNPRGIILSGGPNSVYESGAPDDRPGHPRTRHSGAWPLLRDAVALAPGWRAGGGIRPA